MKLSFKKVVGVILAVLMLASSMSAFACANDTFIAYDQLPDADGKYGKLYKCPEEDRVVRKGSAKEVEWVPAFYEAEYPHLRVDVLVLDGKEQGKIKYATEWDDELAKEVNVYAPVNTKEVPEFWEVKDPYFVFNRLQSDFTGEFKPTTVLKSNGVMAPVEKDWNYRGFDKFVVEGDKVVDYSHMYGKYEDKLIYDWNNLDALTALYFEIVTANFADFEAGEMIEIDIDDDGRTRYDYDFDGKVDYIETVEEIFVKGFIGDFNGKDYNIGPVYNVSWLELEGPDFANGGTKKVVPFEDIVNGKPAEWYDDVLVLNNAPTIENGVTNFLGIDYEDRQVEIGWETIGYELKAPYRYYQALTINGVAMDNRTVEIKGYDVKKEDVVEVIPEMPDEIQVIEKAIELVGYESDSRYDYVLRPHDIEAVRKYSEKYDYKVIENYLLEKVLASYNLPVDGEHREIRFVKVSTQPGTTKLPYIWKYTGGCANPEIEWRVAFAEAAKPYEIYEEKWVKAMNGVFYPTGEYRTTGLYADDVPTVSYEFGQPRVLTVMLEAEVDEQEIKWALENSPYEFIVAGRRLTVIVPDAIYEGTNTWIEDIEARLIDIIPSIREQLIINIEA